MKYSTPNYFNTYPSTSFYKDLVSIFVIKLIDKYTYIDETTPAYRMSFSQASCMLSCGFVVTDETFYISFEYCWFHLDSLLFSWYKTSTTKGNCAIGQFQVICTMATTRGYVTRCFTTETDKHGCHEMGIFTVFSLKLICARNRYPIQKNAGFLLIWTIKIPWLFRDFPWPDSHFSMTILCGLWNKFIIINLKKKRMFSMFVYLKNIFIL